MSRRENLYGARRTLVRIAFAYGLVLHGKQLNATILAKELEVSAKTIYRDLEFMRDSMGLPLVWDARANSYVFGAEHPVPWWLKAPKVLPPQVRVEPDAEVRR